jgi:hypothetical protein
MASASSFHLNQRVSVPGKGVGTIAFIGKTEFADGKQIFFSNFHSSVSIGEWIGIILDEPKGKNNGSVEKKGILSFVLYRISIINFKMEQLFDILHVMIIMVFMFELHKLNLLVVILKQI